MNYLFDEKIVSNYYDLYEQNFISFTNHVIKVLRDNYNTKKKSTKDLIHFLDQINQDKEISKLADSIILRKDISVNLSDVYNILNSSRNE